MTAVLSAVLLFLSAVPVPSAHLVWVALVPWLLHLERGVATGWRLRDGARAGALLFAVFWGLNLYWVPLLVLRVGAVWPVFGYLSQLLLLSLMGGATGAAAVALRARGRLPLPLAAGVAWVGVEWARGALLGVFRFPWFPVSLPLADLLPFVQGAAWVGASGLSLGVVVVNGLLASSLGAVRAGDVAGGARPGWRAWGNAALAALLLGAWALSGVTRLGTLTPGRTVTVGVVQPSVLLAVRRDSARAAPAAMESVRRLLPDLVDEGVELVILPETHFPLLFRVADAPGRVPSAASGEGGARREADAVAAELAQWAATLGADLLVGGYAEVPGGRTNAVLRISSAGVEEAYGKVALVPGVERFSGSGIVPGRGPAALSAPGAPGPLVCIESAWSGLARGAVDAGARWLLNVTNDAWLAEGPAWTRTPAFPQHARHLVLRSVETGVGALRVGNNGLTGVVAPSGAWTLLLPPHVPGVAVAEVETAGPPTFYLRRGDLVGPWSFLLALVAGLGALLAESRGPARVPVDPGARRL